MALSRNGLTLIDVVCWFVLLYEEGRNKETQQIEISFIPNGKVARQ